MEITERDNVHVLSPEGDLTIFEAEEFQEGLVALSRQEGQVELDLSHVTRMDTSGVQLVLAGMKIGGIRISGLTPSIQEQFGKVGCGGLIEPHAK